MTTLRLPDSLAGSATILRWCAEPGSAFTAEQVLVELEAAETLVSLRAGQAGSLVRILAAAGTTVAVGGELADISSVADPAQPQARPASDTASAPAPASAGRPATPILMPQAGNTMEEGTIITWEVQVGDTVSEGQILCEIETDKSTIEFESPVNGTIGAIVVAAGQSIAVKQPIAYLSDGDLPPAGSAAVIAAAAPVAPVAPAAPAAPAPARPTAPAPLAAVRSGGYPASPAARRLAKEQGLDLASIGAGSGPQGRVLSTDLARAGTVATTLAPISGPIAEPVKHPLSKMRKAIATNLQHSKQTIPHFYLAVSVDAGALLAYAKRRKAETGCSVNDVVLAALGRAIHEFPALRSRYENDGIVEYGTANLGLAVGLDDGLVVPVILQVERLTLAQLAVETKRVVENARRGKLENLGKAVFTVSNLGMFGVDRFSAIINPPESGILAVSAAREAVIVKDGAMRPGRLMELTLSADHRVVDGLLAAQFMNRLRELLEAPEQLP
jgi:pyruvate dehydrogenase E2 component (dihydrolipoamide acetyltransferase)